MRSSRPGDTLIVPANESWANSLGQLPDDKGWDLDIAEPATRIARCRAILRLLPDRLKNWPEGPEREILERISCEDLEPDIAAVELRHALRDLSDHVDFPVALRDIARELSSDRRLKIHPHADHFLNAPEELSAENRMRQFPGGLVLIGSRLLSPIEEEPASIDAVTTEDDTSSATVSVALDNHAEGVAKLADQYAVCFGLSESLRLALTKAARWHDLGKADHRFQAWLHNGNAQVARLAPRLLAKSGGIPQGARQREQARARSRYPRGARHELVSVRLAEDLLDRLEASVDRDLVLHLIACHHGHARPLAPVVDDTDPVDVHLAFDGADLSAPSATPLHQLDSGVPERFWSLVRRYGWWRLAWLEALLRLADHRQSRIDQEVDCQPNTEKTP